MTSVRVRIRLGLLAVVGVVVLGLGLGVYDAGNGDGDDDDDVVLKMVATWQRGGVSIVVTHNNRNIVNLPHRVGRSWEGALAVRPTDRVTLWVKQDQRGKVTCDMFRIGRLLTPVPVDHSEREDPGSVRCYFNRAMKNGGLR